MKITVARKNLAGIRPETMLTTRRDTRRIPSKKSTMVPKQKSLLVVLDGEIFLIVRLLKSNLKGTFEQVLKDKPTPGSLPGLHGVKWLCLFCGQQQVFRTHGTISIIWTHAFGQKVR